jgi:hypothetical protein
LYYLRSEFGHGTLTYIGDVREVEEKMGQLFARLESPVLTGIEVHWPEGTAVEAWPQRVPDLYLGEPVVLCARLSGPAAAVEVTGRRGRDEWRASFALDGRRAEGIGVLWARRKIESLLDSLHEGASPDDVKAQVVALGLEHHLVTKHTSLVAVDVTPIRPKDAALERQAIATNLPHGWTYESVFGHGDVRPWPWADTHPVARLLVPGAGVDLAGTRSVSTPEPVLRVCRCQATPPRGTDRAPRVRHLGTARRCPGSPGPTLREPGPARFRRPC